MKLPIAKPLLIAMVAIIAVIGVGAGVMLSTNQAPQGPQVAQSVPSQTQDQLNDSEMMDNLNKSSDELTEDQKGYQGTEDISSEYQGPELTQALNIVKKHPAHPTKPTVKPHKPPANNNNNNNVNDDDDNGNDNNQNDDQSDDDDETVDPGDGQIEEPWDPLEDPGDNPDADDYGDDGSDSGEDQDTTGGL